MLGLIIFGRRNMTKTANAGQFTCPRCGPASHYEHKQVKRWFTLYFIPVIPLGVVGEYVECRACAGTFKPEVLRFALPNATVVNPK
ncbi:MAG TPA: zinc-ribbon domain-containing protein [Kofleriaceae bacterium]